MNIKKIFSIISFIVKNFFKYKQKFLTIIGDIKIYKTPCWCLYNPDEYEYNIRGEFIREINNVIQPGDVVLRGYNHYLDSWLIPGEFSHSGVYIGDNKIIHAIAEGIKEIDLIDFFQCDKACVLRPNKGSQEAVNCAKSFLGKHYDFDFNNEDSSEFYCHEMTANCFKSLNIQAKPITLFGINIKCLKNRYLAESFLSNVNFTKIFHINL